MDDMDAVYRAHAQTVYKFLLAQCRDPDSAEEGVLEQEGGAVPSAADPPAAGVAAGGGLPPGLWKSQLPGDWGCAGKDGELGQSDLLPKQRKTEKRRYRG